MSDLTMNHQVAAWLAKVAKALEDLGDGETGHGRYYVENVSIGYEGETTQYAVVPNDFGGFDLHLDAVLPQTAKQEQLAEAIFEASRADEGTISATGAKIVAGALLQEIPWL